jgi:hypothetical protein
MQGFPTLEFNRLARPELSRFLHSRLQIQPGILSQVNKFKMEHMKRTGDFVIGLRMRASNGHLDDSCRLIVDRGGDRWSLDENTATITASNTSRSDECGPPESAARYITIIDSAVNKGTAWATSKGLSAFKFKVFLVYEAEPGQASASVCTSSAALDSSSWPEDVRQIQQKYGDHIVLPPCPSPSEGTGAAASHSQGLVNALLLASCGVLVHGLPRNWQALDTALLALYWNPLLRHLPSYQFAGEDDSDAVNSKFQDWLAETALDQDDTNPKAVARRSQPCVMNGAQPDDHASIPVEPISSVPKFTAEAVEMLKFCGKAGGVQVITNRVYGFFSNFFLVVGNLLFARQFGLVPVVQFASNHPNYQQQGFFGQHNVWEYYFLPVSNISVELLVQQGAVCAGDVEYVAQEFRGIGGDDESVYFRYGGCPNREHCSAQNETGIDATPAPVAVNCVSVNPTFPERFNDGETLQLVDTFYVNEFKRPYLAAIVAQHVRPRQRLQSIIDSFVQANFYRHRHDSGAPTRRYVIGVHIRSSEHRDELCLLLLKRGAVEEDNRECAGYAWPTVGTFEQLVDKQLEQLKAAHGAQAAANARIFLATDDSAALERMQEKYGAGSSSTTAGGRLVHYTQEVVPGLQQGSGAAMGENALVDALLLSHTSLLIHGISELPFAALYFNGTLPHMNVYDNLR